MKKRFLLIGTVLIIGNVAFAVSLQRPGSQNKQLSTAKHEGVQAALVQRLHARGLEKESAVQKASTLFAGDPLMVNAQLEILFSELKVLDTEKVYDYLAKQALFSKTVDLASYDALIRMVHEIEGRHPDASARETLKGVAQKNSSIA